MTRTEFIERVNDFDSLIQFCYDNQLDFCDDVHDKESAYLMINEMVRDMVDNGENWESIRNFVCGIEPDCDYYIYDEGGFVDADAMYDIYWGDVLNYMSGHGLWDEEEDDDEYDDEDDEEEYDEEDYWSDEYAPAADEEDFEEISEDDFLMVIGKAG